jgi:hypothetical protein
LLPGVAYCRTDSKHAGRVKVHLEAFFAVFHAAPHKTTFAHEVKGLLQGLEAPPPFHHDFLTIAGPTGARR